LAQVLARDLAQLAEQLHPVPFGPLLGVAVAVLAHRGGGQRQGANGHPALRVFHFGIAAEVADQDDFVDAAGHGLSFRCRPARARCVRLYRPAGARPSARDPRDGRNVPDAGWRHPYNPGLPHDGRRMDNATAPRPPEAGAPAGPRDALDLPAIQALAAADMARVDALIRRRLSSDVVLINQVADHIVAAGGKRLRPMLLLLAAAACGKHEGDGVGADAHQLAAVVEFIHTSTLLHDDVVDESDLRRGRSTANAVWG